MLSRCQVCIRHINRLDFVSRRCSPSGAGLNQNSWKKASIVWFWHGRASMTLWRDAVPWMHLKQALDAADGIDRLEHGPRKKVCRWLGHERMTETGEMEGRTRWMHEYCLQVAVPRLHLTPPWTTSWPANTSEQP